MPEPPETRARLSNMSTETTDRIHSDRAIEVMSAIEDAAAAVATLGLTHLADIEGERAAELRQQLAVFV